MRQFVAMIDAGMFLPVAAKMPWVVATLRGKPVFARATSERTLVAESGRVEIRYAKLDSRVYRAALGNLTVDWDGELLADDACVPGAAPIAADNAVTKSAARATSASGPAARSGLVVAEVAADTYVAYTDGACSGNPGPAGLGVVVLAPDGTRMEAYEFLGEATNNVAELTAVLRALQALPGPTAKAVIHTDSQYAIGVISKGWKAKANQALIAQIRACLATRPLAKFVYVRGHSGIPLNERADELARTAVSTRSSGGA